MVWLGDIYVDLQFQAIGEDLASDVKNHNANPFLWDLDPPWLYNKKAMYLRMLIILYWVSF